MCGKDRCDRTNFFERIRLAEKNRALIEKRIGYGCNSCQCDRRCAAFGKRVPSFDPKGPCPYVYLDNAEHVALTSLWAASRVQPLKGWPESWAHWVVTGLSLLTAKKQFKEG